MYFDCVILAAGRSSRMGSWKPEILVNGKNLITWSVENASVNCRKIIVVGGYKYSDLVSLLSSFENIKIVENPNYNKGMATSLKAAMSEIETDRFFVALGDMPYISPGIFSQMSRTEKCDVLFPVLGSRRGHPVLFSRDMQERIMRASDDLPIRDIFRFCDIKEIEVNDPGIFRDIDTPEDLS